MKNIIILLFLLHTSIYSLSYPKETNSAIHTLFSIEEFQALVKDAEKEGVIRIEFRNDSSQFEAYWDGAFRRIILNRHANKNLGNLMISIVFELHNAKRDHSMRVLETLAKRGKICLLEYVESMERLEHINALETKILLTNGIRQGILPKDAYWNVDPDFKEHFEVQKQAGHAQYHGKHYSNIAPRHRVMNQVERYKTLGKMLSQGSNHEKLLALADIQEELILHRTLKNDHSLQLMKSYHLLNYTQTIK